MHILEVIMIIIIIINYKLQRPKTGQHAVQVEKVYQIAPLQIKTWNGVKKLSSTPATLFTKVTH